MSQSPVRLRSHFAQSQEALVHGEKALDPLDDGINEVLLIHGTKPEAVVNILEKNLDPQMAREGLFGKGVYFAEVR